MNVIDLFCGCGGLSYGFEQAGFDIVLGIDNDKMALETFELNHKNSKTLCKDITQLSHEDIRQMTSGKKIDLIIGGPPCQGMSLSGPRRFDDPRNKLYLSYIRLVKEIMPEAFLIENVPGLVRLFDGKIKDHILEKFCELGYTVSHKILCAADYGVPQSRKRVFFIGFRNGTNFTFPEPNATCVACEMALSDLPPLEDDLGADFAEYYLTPQNEYQRLMRKKSKTVRNHVAAQHSDAVRNVISLVPDGKNYKSLPDEYKNTRNFHVAWTRFDSQKPAPTIDTGHRHHFHYKYNRVPTVRECARLQSFPDDFIFLGNKTQQFRQVGNAVPPLLAKALAEEIKGYLKGEQVSAMYQVPQEHYIRLHHVRPRFKGDIESVLIYMSTEISRTPRQASDKYASQVNGAICRYPGNISKTLKTINNWRTEISSLFGFIITESGISYPGVRAMELAEKEDLVESFKLFLYSFQYPGAHIKSHEIIKLIEEGVRFKPAQYILKLLQSGERQSGGRAGITKAEVCHCVFNDLRCVRDNEDTDAVWRRIQGNRDSGVEYDTRGDVIRYAGDIIDYMEIANLLTSYDGKTFYINKLEGEVILKFVNSTEWFDAYDEMITRRAATLGAVNECTADWFKYVNRDIAETDFSTDILAFISSDCEEYEDLKKASLALYDAKLHAGAEISAKEIGDLGEGLVHGHECQRIKAGGREDLMHLIKRIPTQLAVGYDIQSIDLDEKKRYIEVKTTISSKPLHFNRVHLTPNEWRTADSVKDRYFIYRLMISKKERRLFVVQNPVQLYKENKIEMTPKDGADITLSSDAGVFEELLSWTS